MATNKEEKAAKEAEKRAKKEAEKAKKEAEKKAKAEQKAKAKEKTKITKEIHKLAKDTKMSGWKKEPLIEKLMKQLDPESQKALGGIKNKFDFQRLQQEKAHKDNQKHALQGGVSRPKGQKQDFQR